MVVTLRCVPPRLTRSLTMRATKWDDPSRADTAHGVAYVAKRQTDRDSAAPYRSRATVPFVVPGTGRLADGHVVQWSMDGFHNAQSSLGTNLLDGDSAPANADFARMRNRDQTAWTEQLGITVSDPVKFRRAAAEPARRDVVGASDVAVGDRLPGDLADVHPMFKPSTIVSAASMSARTVSRSRLIARRSGSDPPACRP
jgi:hypothetical protein